MKIEEGILDRQMVSWSHIIFKINKSGRVTGHGKRCSAANDSPRHQLDGCHGVFSLALVIKYGSSLLPLYNQI